MSLLQYYEVVALPGLALAQIDVVRGVMDWGRQAEICESVESVVVDLSDHVDVIKDEIVKQAAPVQSETTVSKKDSVPEVVLCLAGRTSIDKALCAILGKSSSGHDDRVDSQFLFKRWGTLALPGGTTTAALGFGLRRV
jgi:hypothetical protein